MSISIETSRSLTTRFTYEALGQDVDPNGEHPYARVWPKHGTCSRPLERRLAGRPDKLLVSLGIEPDKAHIGYMTVRCRKCVECLEHRSRLWSARACDETVAAYRTWFGTLTVDPVQRVRFEYAAQTKASRGGTDWSELRDAERFQRIVAEIGPELGRALKRVRKNSGVPLRYLLVCEAHKDGFPHFHMLLHEADLPVRKRVLDQAWKLGFSKWRLVKGGENHEVFYVCKYLAKSALARVRASQGYGQATRDAGLVAKRLHGAIDVLRHKSPSVGTWAPMIGENGFPTSGE